ncbi:unnamed protein product [Protopolystoma xenopodis]|uniref:Uncharacterized protein n=1 Tax=Protopolystoma xenopodis TaxID=117903 RepID=A0A448WJ97_9PLAT|nr:unnamed protein product [Protopolystoma xenopodis]
MPTFVLGGICLTISGLLGLPLRRISAWENKRTLGKLGKVSPSPLLEPVNLEEAKNPLGTRCLCCPCLQNLSWCARREETNLYYDEAGEAREVGKDGAGYDDYETEYLHGKNRDMIYGNSGKPNGHHADRTAAQLAEELMPLRPVESTLRENTSFGQNFSGVKQSDNRPLNRIGRVLSKPGDNQEILN